MTQPGGTTQPANTAAAAAAAAKKAYEDFGCDKDATKNGCSSLKVAKDAADAAVAAGSEDKTETSTSSGGSGTLVIVAVVVVAVLVLVAVVVYCLCCKPRAPCAPPQTNSKVHVEAATRGFSAGTGRSVSAARRITVGGAPAPPRRVGWGVARTAMAAVKAVKDHRASFRERRRRSSLDTLAAGVQLHTNAQKWLTNARQNAVLREVGNWDGPGGGGSGPSAAPPTELPPMRRRSPAPSPPSARSPRISAAEEEELLNFTSSRGSTGDRGAIPRPSGTQPFAVSPRSNDEVDEITLPPARATARPDPASLPPMRQSLRSPYKASSDV